MRVELPVLKRCCGCLPLRYGLIVWTYIKTIALIPIFFMIATSFEYKSLQDGKEGSSPHIFQQIFGLSVVTFEIIFNVVFLVGGHTKNVKLLKIQYYYNILFAVLFSILGVTRLATLVASQWERLYHSVSQWIICAELSFISTIILIQIYVLLLTRSELVKLSNNCKFRFENNAADSQCVAIVPEDDHQLP